MNGKTLGMMRQFLLALTLFCPFLCGAAADIVLVDGKDGTILAGATVVDWSGLILGMTDAGGAVRDVAESRFPLSVRCVGYDPTTIESPSDTVRMTPATYTLTEMTVASGERPIKRVVCYVREYSTGATGTDTMMLYTDYMTQSFVTEGKVKGYDSFHARPNAIAVRRYARLSNAEGLDSVARPGNDDDLTMLSWMENIAKIPSLTYEEREAISNGAPSDTIFGKYGPKTIFRKTNGLYMQQHDLLSDKKNHVMSPFFFKLLGFTMNFEEFNLSLAHKSNGTGKYTLYDFVYGTYSLHVKARGKWIKKLMHTKDPIEMDCYVELYPIDITNLTVEEYKELSKDYIPVPFQQPENLQPLPPAVDALVERVNRECPPSD